MNAKFSIKAASLICSVSILAACVSNPSRSLSTVSESEAMTVFGDMEIKAEQAKLDLASNGDDKSIDRVRWIQPDNHSEACKLWFDGEWPKDLKVYWDGSCKEGYAIGLGREFAKGFMRDIEAVLYYLDVGKPPVQLTYYDRLKKFSVIYGYDNRNIGLLQQLHPTDQGTALKTILRDVSSLETTGFSFTRESLPLSTTFAKSVSDITLGVHQDNTGITPTKEVFSDGKYNMYAMRNGEHHHQEASTGQLVKLPDEYLKKVAVTIEEIFSNINTAEQAVSKSIDMKEYYKSLVCEESVSVKFMSLDRYQDICGENDYFSEYNDQFRKTRENMVAEVKAKEGLKQAQKDLAAQRAHEVRVARESAPVINSGSSSGSASNTIKCVKFGDMGFNRKIHTFNGMVCPLGYMKH